MRKFSDNEQIVIYSDNNSPMYIPTQYNPNGYELLAVTDFKSPPFITLNYSEIRVLNNSSSAIRIGKIRFDKEVQSEIYHNLGITNWEDILTLEQIEEIVKSPTQNDYEKILSIKEKDAFERIRSVAIAIKNSGSYDISSRFLEMLERRLVEFNKGQINSGIQVKQQTPSQPANTVSQDEFNALKLQNEQMLAQMQALMAQFQQNAQPQVTSTVVEIEQQNQSQEETIKKTAGRPRTK